MVDQVMLMVGFEQTISIAGNNSMAQLAKNMKIAK